METISMSRDERKRLVVLTQVRSGKLTLVQASDLMGLGYRQTKRLWKRFLSEGDAGLVHRARGQAGNRQSPQERKNRVLKLYAQKYTDYGPTLAAECLAQDDGLKVPVSTLRRWLGEANLWRTTHKRKQHRRRRPRRERFGELVQMDGSHHDWFEGRRGEAVLMVAIDDATGHVEARFFEEETLGAAFTMMDAWIERHGLPQGLYVDRSGIYRDDREPTPEEILNDQRPRTQFGRAMDELGVELILARSPQAKGRVERMNRTLQDRLVKALRREKIADLESANRFLEEQFLKPFNARFTVAATHPEDAHRPLADGTDLPRILSVRERRVVRNDWTVSWHNALLQLPAGALGLVRPKQYVEVREQLDGRVRVFVAEAELSWSATRTEPSRRKRKRVSSGPTGSSQGQKPRADHPWRRAAVGAAGSGSGCSD